MSHFLHRAAKEMFKCPEILDAPTYKDREGKTCSYFYDLQSSHSATELIGRAHLTESVSS